CGTVRAFARYAAGEAAAGRDGEAATVWLGEVITIVSGVGASFVANLARLSLATNTARRGDPRRALAHYPVIVQEWRRGGQWAQQWITLRTLVPVLVHVGALEEAAVVLGGLRRHGQADAWGSDAEGLGASDERLRHGLGEAYEVHVTRGSALTPVELVRFAEEASAVGAGLDAVQLGVEAAR
ncbi:MAG: hypothetical protein ACRD2W_05700, partial [Acidimicrobiales bacterium]